MENLMNQMLRALDLVNMGHSNVPAYVFQSALARGDFSAMIGGVRCVNREVSREDLFHPGLDAGCSN